MADDQDGDLSDIIVVKHVRRRYTPRPVPRKQNHKGSNGSAKRLEPPPRHSSSRRKGSQDGSQIARKRHKYGLRRRNLQTAEDDGSAHVLGISISEEESEETRPDQDLVADHGQSATTLDGRSAHNKTEKMCCDGTQDRQAGVEQDDPECAYCLEPLSSAECLVLRACNHKLHRACFDLFPGNTATCCVCNQKSEEVIVID